MAASITATDSATAATATLMAGEPFLLPDETDMRRAKYNA
jgi:hypothetical protein